MAQSRFQSKPQSQPQTAADSLMRNRGVVIAAALVAAVLAAGGGWLAISAMSKEATQSSLLPIRAVRFAGDMQRVDQEELKRIAGGIRTIGGSMLRTDLNQVKALVTQVEWVRDVDVRRRFPDALEIRIEEHQPFARWQAAASDGDADRGLLVNSFGEVFEADTDAALPVLSGPADTSREVMTQWIAFAKQLETPAGSTANLRLAELHLSPRRAWRVRLASGSTLELGRNDPAERLGRFVRAYPGVAALQLANARIDLRYQNGLAVRVARVATAPAAVPAAATKTKQATTKQAITKKAAKK